MNVNSKKLSKRSAYLLGFVHVTTEKLVTLSASVDDFYSSLGRPGIEGRVVSNKWAKKVRRNYV